MPRIPRGTFEKPKKGTIPRLLKILFKEYKGLLVLALIFIILYAAGNITSSLLIRNITDTLDLTLRTGVDPWPELTKILIIVSIVYILGLIAAYMYTRIMAVVTQKYLNTIRIQMFNHMESLPIKYFDTHPRGDIMSLYTNDIDTIRQLISQCLPTTVQAGITIVGTVAVMLWSSIYLFFVVLIGSVSMIFVAKVIGGRSSSYFVKQQRSTGQVEGNVDESINGLKVIKVFNHEDKSIEEFEALNHELFVNSFNANKNGNIMGPINGNIGNFIYVILAILGVTLIMFKVDNIGLCTIFEGKSELTIGTLLSFFVLCRTFTNNVNNFSQQITFIVMGQAGASRIFALLDEESEKDEGYVTLVNIKYHDDGTFEETDERTRYYAWKHPHKALGTITYTELKGDIVLDHVDFGYNEDRLVLHDVSIYAHPGQKIAFVGATGAGKTTITNLINRFYDIADGKIRYDGININKIKKDDLRRSLGIVLQDTNLFTGTVMENIRYGRLDATDEEVIEAAKIANAYDFITRLPEGFNTMLSGDGTNLSQGQRQLLSIARAAVADTPVMILDEATSSIDTRTEKLVQQGMDKLMEGRTVFVIAHRLSTVQNSNAIMVLDHGRIIERGTHDDLIKQKGVYYQLYTGAFELE